MPRDSLTCRNNAASSPDLQFSKTRVLVWLRPRREGTSDAIIDMIAETFPRLKQRLTQEAVTLSGESNRCSQSHGPLLRVRRW